MRVFRDFPRSLPEEPVYPVVAVGVFDGVHRGHWAILETALATAAGKPVAIVTFDPHPRAVLGPPKPHRLLTTLEERLELLDAWPIAAVAVLRFDAQVARQSYREFVGGPLVGGLGARTLVFGTNVRLGHAREGTPDKLAELGRELGYEVVLVPPVEVDGEPASSTRVRHLLDAGEVEAAARVLGRSYALHGPVVHGAGRGVGLGFPTANIEVPAEKLVPGHGVYAGWVSWDDERWPAAINIGTAPTFADDARRSIEAHLIGYDGDLYGRRIEVALRRRLRGERRFESVEALRERIAADLVDAQKMLAEEGGAA